MSRKKLLLVLLVVGLAAAIYAWFGVYNKPHKNIAKAEPAYTYTATELTEAFTQDEKVANKNYLDEVIQVSGTIAEIKPGGDESLEIVINAENSTAIVSCNLETKRGEVLSMHPEEGKGITLKGVCTGSQQADLLGVEVVLERCVVISIE